MTGELHPSELLGAASAYASAHPAQAPDALLAVLAAADVSPADPRRSDATRALALALGPDYADGQIADRLADLAATDGPRGVAAVLVRAARIAERWELRPPPQPRDLTRDEAKAERHAVRQAWAADPSGMLAAAGERFGPLAGGIAADYWRRFGEPPAGADLAGKLGAPAELAPAVLAAIVAAGWLADAPDGLRAGPRWAAEGAAWAAAQTASGRGPRGHYFGGRHPVKAGAE